VQVQPQVDREILEDLERYGADAAYFDAHRAELLEGYPDHWVAVYNQEVVGAAREIEDLVKVLEGKGIQPGRTYREYLTDKEELLILPASS
jgi:hypothetical protein